MANLWIVKVAPWRNSDSSPLKLLHMHMHIHNAEFFEQLSGASSRAAEKRFYTVRRPSVISSERIIRSLVILRRSVLLQEKLFHH
jgi:hypothetical protein